MTQKVTMVIFKTVCHYLNLATPEYDDVNSTDDACDDEDDALSELLAAMSPCSSGSDSEEELVTMCPVSDNDEDEESSEDDKNWYEKQNYDVDSVTIPVNTTDYLIYPQCNKLHCLTTQS